MSSPFWATLTYYEHFMHAQSHRPDASMFLNSDNLFPCRGIAAGPEGYRIACRARPHCDSHFRTAALPDPGAPVRGNVDGPDLGRRVSTSDCYMLPEDNELVTGDWTLNVCAAP